MRLGLDGCATSRTLAALHVSENSGSSAGSSGSVPEGADPAVHALKTQHIRPRRTLHIGQQPHLYLANLVTDPAQRGRGAGRMLVEWGCAIADAEGVMSYVQASPEGRGVYERCGFGVVWGVEEEVGGREEVRKDGEGEEGVGRVEGKGGGEGMGRRWYRSWLMERRPKGK